MAKGRQAFKVTAKPSKEARATYPLVITLYQADESTPRVGATIQAKNIRTEDTMTKITDSDGKVLFDLDTFSLGYDTSDLLEIEKLVSHSDMEYYVSANGHETNPAWVEVSEGNKTRIYPNSARFKLNTNRYEGGREINLTLN